jgi:hypothetical protein
MLGLRFGRKSAVAVVLAVVASVVGVVMLVLPAQLSIVRRLGVQNTDRPG